MSEDQKFKLVKRTGKYGNTLLYVVIDRKDADLNIIRSLIGGLSVDRKTKLLMIQGDHGQTALHAAAERGHTNVIKYLLEGIAVEQRFELLKKQDKYGSTVLHILIKLKGIGILVTVWKDFSAIQKVELMATPEIHGNTAFYMASKEGDTAIFQELLNCLQIEQKFELSKVAGEFGKTSLYVAAEKGHTDVIKLLLGGLSVEQKAEVLKIQLIDSDENTYRREKAAQSAVILDNMDGSMKAFLKQLLEMEGEYNHNTMLTMVRESPSKVINTLIENISTSKVSELLVTISNTADVSSTVEVHDRCRMQERLIRGLLDICYNSENTALHIAAQKGNTAVIRSLTDDLPPNLKMDLLALQNKYGFTPVQMAKVQENEDTVEFLNRLVETTLLTEPAHSEEDLPRSNTGSAGGTSSYTTFGEKQANLRNSETTIGGELLLITDAEEMEQGPIQTNRTNFIQILERLNREIKRFLREKNVDTFEMYHDPDDLYRIIINGVNVERINANLTDLLDTEFPGFSVHTTNITCAETEYPDLSMWINLFVNSRASLHSLDKRLSTVGLLLQGRQPRELFHPYGATTAHTFMTESERLDLAYAYRNHRQTLNRIARLAKAESPFVRLASIERLEIEEAPLIVYTYFYPFSSEEEEEDSYFTYDLAIAKVNSQQLFNDARVSSSATDIERSGRWTVQCSIIEINSRKDLFRYIGRRVVCGGKLGTIQSPVNLQQGRWVGGAFIAFTMDDGWESFGKGDCGTMVYLVDLEDSTKLHRLGMLYGNVKGKTPASTLQRIFQAMCLSFAIKKIEQIEGSTITDISPLGDPEPSINNPDDQAEQVEGAAVPAPCSMEEGGGARPRVTVPAPCSMEEGGGARPRVAVPAPCNMEEGGRARLRVTVLAPCNMEEGGRARPRVAALAPCSMEEGGGARPRVAAPAPYNMEEGGGAKPKIAQPGSAGIYLPAGRQPEDSGDEEVLKVSTTLMGREYDV